MIPTDRHLIMSEKASCFFKDYTFEPGDYFGGRTHKCTNNMFWKNTGVQNWKKVMVAGAGELMCDKSCKDGDPNYMLNCGHKAYEGIFPIFRPDELLEMLDGFSKGYFTIGSPLKWNLQNPLETMMNITSFLNINHREYFKTFQSIEEYMLAFFMLEVNLVVWNDTKENWMPNNDWKPVENWKAEA